MCANGEDVCQDRLGQLVSEAEQSANDAVQTDLRGQTPGEWPLPNPNPNPNPNLNPNPNPDPNPNPNPKEVSGRFRAFSTSGARSRWPTTKA